MTFAVPKNTPGPSPWYMRDCEAPGAGLHWRVAGDGAETAGKTLLVGPAGVYAVLDFQNYAMPLGGGFLAIWHQRHTTQGPTEPVVITLLKPLQLEPLSGDEPSLCKSLTKGGHRLLYQGQPEAVVRLETTRQHQRGIEFLPPLQAVGELLILCHSSYANAEPNWERSNLALMVVDTRLGTLDLYPQDWFNAGDLDFGYQWVTRVARDPSTGCVHGEGIRISPFRLAESLRSLTS
jgi:hypothetical protein